MFFLCHYCRWVWIVLFGFVMSLSVCANLLLLTLVAR